MSLMIEAGEKLRKIREERNISQARLAELTRVPQHLLSSYELGKSVLADEHLSKVTDVLQNISDHESAINRKKRYQSHSYNETRFDVIRAESAKLSKGNSEYLRQLEELKHTERPKFTGLSLFSGCGGFSLGFRSAGCEIKGFVEIDDGLASIYEKNFPTTERLGSDITQISSDTFREFKSRVGNVDVIIGGPPCQGFSLSGKRKVDDPRNYLFQDYMRVIDIFQPKIAVIENVRLLTSMKSKTGGLVKDQIADELERHGYDARLFEVNACNFGVPQHRERVFFMAVRKDLRKSPTFPIPEFLKSASRSDGTRPVRTFADACSDLEYLESGQTSDDCFHNAVKHPDHVIEWLWDVPQGASAHDNEDPKLRPPSGYNTTYKRQIWDEPASTVQTTFGMISGCRNVHPIATRSLTIREAARLQSFPDSYKFCGSLGTIRTGIGNAVPPLLARRVAQHACASFLDLVEVTSF